MNERKKIKKTIKEINFIIEGLTPLYAIKRLNAMKLKKMKAGFKNCETPSEKELTYYRETKKAMRITEKIAAMRIKESEMTLKYKKNKLKEYQRRLK